MQSIARYSFILILSGAVFCAQAQAANLSLVGGLNRHHPSTNPDPPASTTLNTGTTFDFGALVDMQLSDRYRFETGLIRHSRLYSLEGTTSTTETAYKGWLIPLTFRFMRAEFLGFGFGPYVAFMTSATKSTTTYANGAPATVLDFKDGNRKAFEVGIRANLRIQVPIPLGVKFLVDVSYLLGVTDMNRSPVAEDKSQEFLTMVGFQIPLSEDDQVPEGETNPALQAPAQPAAATPDTSESLNSEAGLADTSNLTKIQDIQPRSKTKPKKKTTKSRTGAKR